MLAILPHIYATTGISGGDLCLTLGDQTGGLGTGVPQRGPGGRAMVRGLGDEVPAEAVSLSVYSGPKIPCFANL